jgi:DNA-binding transcriptional ArsR family regulator
MAASSRAGKSADRQEAEAMGAVRDRQGELLAVLQHPLRRAILRKLVEASAPLSPREASDGLDSALSNVSYHFRVLLSGRLAVLDHTQQVRGSLQHFYVVDPSVDQFPWVKETLGLQSGT